jgi:GAF domain-containing protein
MTNPAGTGMELRDLLQDTAFLLRNKYTRRSSREAAALRRLARIFTESPELILQELVNCAVEFCGADSSGISLEEPDEHGQLRFRWIAVAGSFAPYLNGTTPRNYSPCGTCLDSGRPQIYRVTQPFYDLIGVKADPIREGLLIPWVNQRMRGTLWAVSHHSSEAFDRDDYELMSELADFASLAIQHQLQELELRERERNTASFSKAHELAHRINNPLQSLTNNLFLASQGGETASEYCRAGRNRVADPHRSGPYSAQPCKKLGPTRQTPPRGKAYAGGV